MCVSSNSFKLIKSLNNSSRNTRLLNTSFYSKSKPLKNLTVGHFSKNGRNGTIVVKHKGGGASRCYRKVDFSRKSSGGLVIKYEYDPYRNPWILRIFHVDTHKHSYILGVKNLKLGIIVENYESFKNGYHLYLKDLPAGYIIHNLSGSQTNKGTYLRSAGVFGILVIKTSKYARVKLRSGEHKYFSLKNSASLGKVSNEESMFVKIGKAGRNRWKNIRPSVRGVAINPVDHPHGGGEGKTSGGRPSVSPWGKPVKGKPTVTNFKSCRLSIRKK